MAKVKVKAFIQALNNFHENLYEMKKYVKDKRITQSEKKILECWLLLRENKFTSILETLPKLETNYDEVVEAQKNLIWGITYNNKTEYDKAVSHIEAAIPMLKKWEIKSQEFTALYNVFIAYFNKKSVGGMKSALDRLQVMDCPTKRHQTLLLQCEFNYNSFINDNRRAGKILLQLNEFKDEMSEPMLMTHLVSQFCYYIKIENFEGCGEILDELKTKRSFAHGANFKFMKLLLSHLLNNSPIYAYEKHFAEFPYLYWQIKVIQCLEGNNIPGAKKYWSELQQKYSEIYLDDFNYAGDKSLFSLCLEKHKEKLTPVGELLISHLSKEEALLAFIKHHKTAIDKDTLYEKIWGGPSMDKTDFQKLQKAISRLRERGHEIEYVRGCYRYLKQIKKAS